MIERGEIKPAALRVLSPLPAPGFPCQTSSRLYPDWAFAVLKETPPELARQVAIALLEMPRTAQGYRSRFQSRYESERRAVM